jgi:16S rRNA (cytosine967-C5)-methyltransferase
MSSQSVPSTSDDVVPGLKARKLAMLAIDDFLVRSQPIDDSFEKLAAGPDGAGLEPRDRALARAIVMVATRRLGTIGSALSSRMERGLPKHSGRLESILVTAAAQLLYLDVPDHAAVDLGIRLVHEDPEGRRFVKFANAVLRSVARERDDILAADDPLGRDTPEWLRTRWIKRYGEAQARKIASAHMTEPSVDITTRDNPAEWAEKLDAIVLPTGSLRLRARTDIADLPGYNSGAWWVQDAAAALPVRLLAPQPGEMIADLCAAPGGKTAQLAAAGAHVTAVDRSAKRLERLHDNMTRLGLHAEIVTADATKFRGGPFDAILLDAPCSATGTIRRHPDVAWTKTDDDLGRLMALQARLLDHAVNLLKVGGRLIYCTCSLEPEEGEDQIEALLKRCDHITRARFDRSDMIALGSELACAINAQGELRTLPFMLPADESRLAGLDGFFAARLIRT